MNDNPRQAEEQGTLFLTKTKMTGKKKGPQGVKNESRLGITNKQGLRLTLRETLGRWK